MEPGRLVRELRRRSGLTQRQLAIRAGTTTSAISRLEQGHVSPTLATVRSLLLCLGYRLQLEPEPLTPATEASQLAAVADLSPDQRLDHGLASQRALAPLIGAVDG